MIRKDDRSTHAIQDVQDLEAHDRWNLGTMEEEDLEGHSAALEEEGSNFGLQKRCCND